MADGPLIVQSDRTVLLEVAHPKAEDARHELAIFAELERARAGALRIDLGEADPELNRARAEAALADAARHLRDAQR